MDGDLQHKPSCLKKMIKIYEKKKPDILIGTRKFLTRDGLSFVRRNLSKLIVQIINNILFEKRTNDPMSGFFIIKKKIFLRSEKKLFNSGFKILADIIYSYKNLKIEDFNIKFEKRKFNKSKLNYSILFKIICLLFYKIFQKKI